MSSFALASQSSFVSINRNKRPIKVIFFTIGLYIYEFMSLTIGLWILLNKDLIINFYESCSCHCSCCVIHNNNNNIYMLWCNTQQQQQQHNNKIKKLKEICYRKKCITDLSTCSTPNETTYKVTTDI